MHVDWTFDLHKGYSLCFSDLHVGMRPRELIRGSLATRCA